ncbi:MAG: hypothetical protein CMJ31_10395 [Phycisphaerae bacterium]|nr:hypothetical protein [Phycisphaerae bacterium]|tara:strand:+ start:1220 stop:1816 length:597 start_codon:yes stop_codon:yes gene_type:complete
MTKKSYGLAVAAAIVASCGSAASAGPTIIQKWIQNEASNIDGIRVSLATYDTNVSDDFELVSLRFPRSNGADSGFDEYGDELVAGLVHQGMTTDTDANFRFDVKFAGTLLAGGAINSSSQIDFAWDIEYIVNGVITHGFRWTNNSSYAAGFSHAASNVHGGDWYCLPQSQLGHVVPLPHPAAMGAFGLAGMVATRRRR